jgi:hypothetical protein
MELGGRQMQLAELCSPSYSSLRDFCSLSLIAACGRSLAPDQVNARHESKDECLHDVACPAEK